MAVNLQVCGPLMENRISSNVKCTLVVTKQDWKLGAVNMKIFEWIEKPLQFTCSRCQCMVISFRRGSKNLICFWVLHDIKELPKKKHYPVMERLVSTQPAQSASGNPCKIKEEFMGKNKPFPEHPLRYLSTINAALWCI